MDGSLRMDLSYGQIANGQTSNGQISDGPISNGQISNGPISNGNWEDQGPQGRIERLCRTPWMKSVENQED